MSATEEKVTLAWNEIFKEDPQDLGLAVSIFGKFGYNELLMTLAESPQAQKQGVDAFKYGAQVVDPTILNEKEREYYDAWREEKPNDVIYQDQLATWTKYGASPDHLRADLRGQISPFFYGEGKNYVQKISPGALETMGGSFNQAGHERGAGIAVPIGTEVGPYWSHNSDVHNPESELNGYSIYFAEGAPSGGLFGALSDVTGIGEFEDFADDIVPNELWAFADFSSFGLASGTLGGSKAKRASNEQFAKLGLDEDVMGIINSVGQVAATVVSGGTAAPALAVANAANAASLGGADFGFEEALVQAGPAVLATQFGLDTLDRMVLSAGQEALQGGDWADVTLAAGWAYGADYAGAQFGRAGSLAMNLGKAAGKVNRDLEHPWNQFAAVAAANIIGDAYIMHGEGEKFFKFPTKNWKDAMPFKPAGAKTSTPRGFFDGKPKKDAPELRSAMFEDFSDVGKWLSTTWTDAKAFYRKDGE